MANQTARTRQPTREMQRRCRRKRRAKMVQRLLYAAAVLLVAGAVAMVLYGGSPLHAHAEPQPAAAPADMPVQTEPTALPTAQGQYVVAIDPGHGGINPNIGAEDYGSEADGLRESDITLRTAQLLYDKLAADDRFAPLLTADGSTYLKPSERAAVAKNAGADLLLSIHLNSDASAATNGLECYAVPPALAANAESVRFGRLVTAAFRDRLGLTLRGWDGVRYLYFDANNARVVAESSDTTARTDPTFTVLEECGCPAVLMEEGFITNAADRAAVCSDSACELAAELYYQCIIDFFAE